MSGVMSAPAARVTRLIAMRTRIHRVIQTRVAACVADLAQEQGADDNCRKD